jgi:uncharacterized protein YuzE
MQITYDSEGDVLYIRLRGVPSRDSMDIEEDGVRVDLDDEGHLVGLEILDASERLSSTELSNVTYEELVSEKKAKLSLPAVLKASKAS